MRANRKKREIQFLPLPINKNIRPYIIFVLANILKKKKTCKEKLNGEKRAAALKNGRNSRSL